MSGHEPPTGAATTPTPDGDGAQIDPSATQPQVPEFTWTGWLFGLIQRTFLLLVLYALSIGPLYWQWYGGRFAGGSTWMAMFYEPLFVAAQLIPPFGKWMDWYVNLWIG